MAESKKSAGAGLQPARSKPEPNLLDPDEGAFGIGPYFEGAHRKRFFVRPLKMRDLIEQDSSQPPPGLDLAPDEWRMLNLLSRRTSIEGIPDESITPEFILDLDPDDRYDIDEAIERQVKRLRPFRSGSLERFVKRQLAQQAGAEREEAEAAKARLGKIADRRREKRADDGAGADQAGPGDGGGPGDDPARGGQMDGGDQGAG